MAIKNIVTAGDYKGYIYFKNKKKGLYIKRTFHKTVYINKKTVELYEIVGEEQTKSFGSGVMRGIAGATLFGGIGAIAGAASAKKKGAYTVSILFKDKTRCLCELDDFMYKKLVEVLY